MKLFRKSDRLKDRKEKTAKEIRRPKPVKPLSALGCVLLLALSAALFCYGALLLTARITGVETEAAAHTRLNAADGETAVVEVTDYLATVSYTYSDAAGLLHQGSANTLGMGTAGGSSIMIRYLPFLPDWSFLSAQTDEPTLPILCLLLAALLTGTGVSRLKELGRGKETSE